MQDLDKEGGLAERRAMSRYERRAPLVRRVCRAMAGGATLAEACRDPMLPPAQDVARWAAEDVRFAEMIAGAREAGGTGHLARPGRPGRWSQSLANEFLARIAAGRGLAEVCAEADMPTHTTIYRWLRTRTDFACAYAEAREMQADLLFDLAWLIARQAREETVRVSRLMVDTIRWRCARLAPRVYGTARPAVTAEPAAVRPTQVEIRRWAKGDDGALREVPGQVHPYVWKDRG
jgi:hypothetical protein